MSDLPPISTDDVSADSMTPPSDPASEADSAGGLPATVKISKSERIRQFLKQHPNTRNVDVAEALRGHGVTQADVANVKSQLKRKRDGAAGKKKPERKPVGSKKAAAPPAATAPPSSPSQEAVSMELLQTGVELVRKAGSIERAEHVLSIIREIRSLPR